MDPSEPSSLNARRDAYVRGIRALLARFQQVQPGDLKGILGRAESVLGAQAGSLDRLLELDLEAPPERERETIEVLLRAQHLPRMVLAFGEVMVQEEQSQVLRPVQLEALALARELALLTQAWVSLHADELGGEEEGEYDA